MALVVPLVVTRALPELPPQPVPLVIPLPDGPLLSVLVLVSLVLVVLVQPVPF